MRWEGHLARMVEKRNTYRVLVGIPEGKRSVEDLGACIRVIKFNR